MPEASYGNDWETWSIRCVSFHQPRPNTNVENTMASPSLTHYAYTTPTQSSTMTLYWCDQGGSSRPLIDVVVGKYVHVTHVRCHLCFADEEAVELHCCLSRQRRGQLRRRLVWWVQTNRPNSSSAVGHRTRFQISERCERLATLDLPERSRRHPSWYLDHHSYSRRRW